MLLVSFLYIKLNKLWLFVIARFISKEFTLYTSIMKIMAGKRVYSTSEILRYFEARGYSRQPNGLLYIKNEGKKQHIIIPPSVFTVYGAGMQREISTPDKQDLKIIGKEIKRADLAFIIIAVDYKDIRRRQLIVYVIDHNSTDSLKNTWMLVDPFFTGDAFMSQREKITMDYIADTFIKFKFDMGIRLMKQEHHIVEKRIW